MQTSTVAMAMSHAYQTIMLGLPCMISHIQTLANQPPLGAAYECT
ncbi:hypothetical protein [Neorhodopirellula lusitana]|nr:hypothetical protein [Neorhodopirellula lusitana]